MNDNEPAHDPLPDEDQVDLFLNGHCAAFAYGAWIALGNPTNVGISVLLDDDGEPNTDDGRRLIHAFLSSPSYDIDARGLRSPAQMAEEYGLCAFSIDGPFPPPIFKAIFCGHDGPFECEDHMVTMAVDFVQRNLRLPLAA